MPASTSLCGRPKPEPHSSTKSRRSSSWTPPAPASLRTRGHSPRRRSDERHMCRAAVGSSPGVPAPFLTISRALGGAAGRSATGPERSLVSAAASILRTPPARALAVVGTFEPVTYTIEIAATASRHHDLGIVVPGGTPGQLRQLRYTGVPLDTGGIARVEITFRRDLAPLGIDRSATVSTRASGRRPAAVPRGAAEGPLSEAAGVRLSRVAGDIRDPATYGLLVGVLFDKPVTAASAQIKTNYTIEDNRSLARVSSPVDGWSTSIWSARWRPLSRSLSVTDVIDARGHSSRCRCRSRWPTPTAPASSARCASTAWCPVQRPEAHGRLRAALSFDVATIRADQNGAFDFDFVPRLGNVVLTAQHPGTQEITSLSGTLRGSGEQLLLNPTFQGKGSVRGRLLGRRRDPRRSVQVALLPGAVLGLRGYEPHERARGVPVHGRPGRGLHAERGGQHRLIWTQSSGLLPSAGRPPCTTSSSSPISRRRGSRGSSIPQRRRHARRRFHRLRRQLQSRHGPARSHRPSPPTKPAASRLHAPCRRAATTSWPWIRRPGTGVVHACIAGLTTSVSIVLEATGIVEGVVFNARACRCRERWLPAVFRSCKQTPTASSA